MEISKKRSKKNLLTKEEKQQNKSVSSKRVAIENIIRDVKIFRIVAEKYRNRRKKFGL
ncbi:MAG TPA: transposase family protein [Bacteroidia bacterium]